MDKEQAAKFMSDLLRLMLSKKASDLFITAGFPPAMKIDGKMTPVSQQSLSLQHTEMLARAIMNEKQAAEFEASQECNFAINPAGIGRFRVNAFVQQQRVGMVLRTITTKIPEFDDLGLPQILKDVVMSKRGLVIFVGGTGSGKSTSMAALIGHRNKNSYGHIITIEDPVEYKMPGIVQIAVKPEIGLTFGTGLRSILRGDPNVVMIGEMRDLETTEIAVRAALTGHLVFSTLHTNDAIGGITRLIDMGVEPFLVATSVNVIAAQRLIRRVCATCKEPDPHHPPPEALLKFGFTEDEINKGVTVMHGRGCETCGKRGYKGRVAVYEVLEMSETLKDMILTGASALELREQGVKEGMITMRRSGCYKIMSGMTNMEEVARETVV
ncbi:MAG: Flp pilus assembly complex ATPase component TadA [Proteobacteria bacterium]|nr:Flp pilus assembly complex ATPase component TadA [Pseudomonadota bacterium]